MNRIYRLIDWVHRQAIYRASSPIVPHREKLGWLEIAHLMGPSIMYNYDVAAVYAKIARDTVESQQPSGLVPTIVPQYVVFFRTVRRPRPRGGAPR